MSDSPYILSGRNTIIHKVRKIDLILVNEVEFPNVKVSQRGVEVYEGPVPRNKREAKEAYCEVLHLTTPDVFGDTKKLVFVQCLNGKEYKIDYSKVGTPLFIRIHQQNYL